MTRARRFLDTARGALWYLAHTIEDLIVHRHREG